MCLIVLNTEIPKIKKNGRITVYKVLEKSSYGNIVTPYRGRRVKSGWLKAGNYKISKILRHGDYVEHGAIHCWEKESPAKHSYPVFANGATVIKCEALVDDFIARGINGDLAFKKIYVSKKQLAKVK